MLTAFADVGDAARLPAPQHSEPLARVARTYALARALLGVSLLTALAALHAGGMSAGPLTGTAGWALLAGYAAQSLLLVVWGGADAERSRSAQGLSRHIWTIGVDLLAFGLLHALEAAGQFNGVALLVLPVLMAGVLLPRRLALATAAAVTLMLLASAWRGVAAGGGSLAQAGLAGMGLFVIAWLAGELAARLLREERLARGSLAMARQQADLNRLVIDEMAEGALIVDAGGRIVAANPAACALLAIRDLDDAHRVGLDQRTEWAGLAALVRRGFVEGQWPADGHELAWHTVRAQARQVRLRARPVAEPPERGRSDRGLPGSEDAASPSTALCLLLIEDVRDARLRLQQEKLAAMGRVSAGLAHEIRNPLAAIAQANALLAEGDPRQDQERLVSIVSDNVRRLRQVVDDVLEAVPGATATTGPVDVTAWLPGILEDWRQTVGAGPGVPQWRPPGEALVVAFDAEHLRRVLVNLLDNAWMHASRQTGSIVVELEAVDAHTVALTVLNDGPAIAAEARAHLFEPFFSTRSRGTGLGLYLCRELCERHGARIAHVPEAFLPAQAAVSPDEASSGRLGTRFVVTFERLAAEAADAADAGLTRKVRR